MTAPMTPRPGKGRKRTLLRVLGAALTTGAVLVAVVVLYHENVIITTGPSRHDVTATAEATAGVEVRVSGVPVGQRAAFARALVDRIDESGQGLPADQGGAYTYWRSDTSASGAIQISAACPPIARWP